MDDAVDLRGREAILPDHSGSVACFNVNMTSIDSGVETGNDSNDSSTVQQEGQQQQPSQIISNDEARRSSSDVMLLQDRIESNKYLHYEMFDMRHNTHKASELLKPYELRREKIKERILHSWRKGTTHFALSDWQTERIQRRMRLAATTNNVTLMKRLLSFGVSPNNHDEHGRTPLHISACRGYTEIVRLLLENGADPNQRDCIGNTPLHLATVNNKLSVVMPLLTAGTDVLALDSYGYNPLQLAKTKLRMLQRNCNNEDMLKVKEEMHDVINMLMAYLQKQKNMREQVETLSNFCSRLSLSSTSDQIQDDVKDLLANINALSITG